PLSLQQTADLIDVVDAPGEVIGIGRAAAAAVKPGEAFLAFLFCINVAVFKLSADIWLDNAFVHIAQQELFLPHELVTGIEIAPGRYRQILRTGTAAGQPLVHTGSTR